ncbi:translation initiation factor SUI1 family protein [Cryptosporidium andersoni]|uniref:Translation initiation factor SUI1 family protein n=1 Tax=Cryptosporidium andersoni TaxID=117008 RepID=A0A1J4MUB3_9CRYT|nr:translation initiation factor SUI1 family protein [Cryptosporidium andersoni]
MASQEFEKNTIKQAFVQVYCSKCGLPPDYCEYGPTPEICLELKKYVNETSDTNKNITDSLKTEGNQEVHDKQSKDICEPNQNETVNLKSYKVKKSKPKIVTVKVESRTRRKSVTVVTGLELFDISLSEAAKKFAKHFSCGSSVVKGINGKADHIDVQGDFYTTIADFILKTYPQIEANNIIIQS